MLLNGTIPLFFELAAEAAYPIPAVSAAMGLMLVQNLVQSAFLAVPVDGLGTRWMNWSMAIFPPLLASALALCSRERHYARSAVDQRDGLLEAAECHERH